MELLRTRLCEWRPTAIDALALAPPSVPEPRLALGRANGAIELWDTSTWHARCVVPGCEQRSVRGFVWTRGEEEGAPWRLLSAGLHTEITEWDVATLEPLISVSSGGGAVWSVCASGDALFAVCDDGSVRVFSLAGGVGSLDYKCRMQVGKERLLCATMPSKKCLFVGGSDSRITKWSVKTGTCDAKMQLDKPDKRSETLVWCLESLGEGEVASGDSLGVVQIWDTVTCTALYRFSQHQADVLALAFSPSGALLASGVDAKVSTFVRQMDAEERWVFVGADFNHTHDVRALAAGVKGGASADINSNAPAGWYLSGGVTGKLMVHNLRCTAGQPVRQPLECSGFSPIFQTASLAQESRVVLCQRDAVLEFWYLQQPKAQAKPVAGIEMVTHPGRVLLSPGQLPEPQLLLRVGLGDSEAGRHVAASALAPDGRRFVASDAAGTRLFKFSIEDLEVRKEKALPVEVQRVAASALLFCGAGLLAMASRADGDILVLDALRLAVAARFRGHHAVGASVMATAGEWLASADTAAPASSVHVFNVDSLRHHAKVPVGEGRGFPTALGFDARGERLLLALSSHEILVFDVEAQNLVREITAAASIPRSVGVYRHQRVCGIVPASPALPDKVLVWGHTFLLTLDLKAAAAAKATGALEGVAAAPAPEPKRSAKRARWEASRPGAKRRKTVDDTGAWRRTPGVLHILSLQALDQAHWGPPVLQGHCLTGPKVSGSSDAGSAVAGQAVGAMVLTLEVAPEAVAASLPQAFERKAFFGNRPQHKRRY